MQLPQWNVPDDAAVKQKFQQDQQGPYSTSKSKSNGPQFLRFLGPNGETNWSNVPVGYEAQYNIWVLPTIQPGKDFRVKSLNHFMRPNGKGRNVPCTGDDNCLICQVRKDVLFGGTADEALVERAKSQCKISRQWYYNVLLADTPDAHYYTTDQQMRPLILAAGHGMDQGIEKVFDACGGASQALNPQMIQKMIVSRKKTGPSPMNIEYSVVPVMNSQAPLPEPFWPAFNNVWDLEAQLREPLAPADVIAIIEQSGLPVPGHQPAAYTAAPQAPHGNPYQQPQAVPPPPQHQVPVVAQPPVAYTPQVPVAPPVQSAPPVQQPAPVMNPPVVEVPQQPTQQYSPQPSQVAAPPPPPPPPGGMPGAQSLEDLQNQMAGVGN